MDLTTMLMQFHFIRPLWLWLNLPFLLLVVYQLRTKAMAEQNQPVLPEHLQKALKIGDAAWRKRLPLKVWAVGFCLATVIVAGPTWQRQASPFGEDNAPLVILLDVSESMLQTDIQPSRLARAKQKITDLLAVREGGATALIVYSGSAHIAMPLTKDKAVFLPLLAAINPKIMPRKGKFAEYGLAEVDKLLFDTKQANPLATILWVTDGLGANTQQAFKEYFAQTKQGSDAADAGLVSPSALQLLILGSGDLRRPSEIEFQHAQLTELAAEVGGYYQSMTVDNDDVNAINKQIARNVIINNDSAEPWQEMAYPLVFVLAAIFLLWFRKGWTVQWCFVGALLLAAPQPSYAANVVNLVAAPAELTKIERLKQSLTNFWLDAWLTAEQQGQLYFSDAEYSKAAEKFTDPYRKATAYYMAEDFKAAQAYFMRVDSAEALFGAANALAQQREYIAARQVYQQAIAQYPNYQPAQINLKKLQKIIDDINRQSESQANTENEISKELGDEPQTGEGAEEKVSAKLMAKETFTAAQLLADDELTQAWMKRVEGSPSRFLATKFRSQLNQRPQTTPNQE